jgi:hypothetical protein
MALECLCQVLGGTIMQETFPPMRRDEFRQYNGHEPVGMLAMMHIHILMGL